MGLLAAYEKVLVPVGAAGSVLTQRPSQDAYLITDPKLLTPQEFDQSAPLARLNLRDHRISDPRRPKTIHDQTEDADAPSRRMPLRLDHKEGIARKKGRPNLNPAAVRQTRLADPRKIRRVARQAEAMERKPFPMRLEAGTGPVSHELHRLEAVAVTATGSRILGADRLA